MSAPELKIRIMTRGEVELAVEWAAREGWNPGLMDAGCFHAADPQGFLIGVLGDKPVAIISAVAYGADLGFIGFYIVDPVYRRQGHGWRIWPAGMAREPRRRPRRRGGRAGQLCQVRLHSGPPQYPLWRSAAHRQARGRRNIDRCRPRTYLAAIALAERYGLSPAFETARMYRGHAPDLPIDRIFGITTFELG